MTPRLRFTLVSAAFAVLAIVAVMGWARKPQAAPLGYNVAAGHPVRNAGATPIMPMDDRPTYYQQRETAYATAAAPCVQSASYDYEVPAYAHRYSVRTVRPRVIEPAPQPVYEERRVVRRGRSKGKSVAIVAGSAGVGAAIGAIAGGGKGAAIGALAGGGGGFVYDRLTHNR